MGELTHLLARIPHRGPMCFIDDVISVTPNSVTTTMTLRADHILAVDGLVSPIAAIELFAQSAAVLMSHRTSGSDPNPVAGALLGTRGVDFLVPSLRVGDVLRVVATESWGANGALAQFDCELFRGPESELCARGTINVVGEALPPR
jgi:predicted hotdog family 3-hydroxylacyl-ACP dehydratase